MDYRLDAGIVAASQETPEGFTRLYLRVAKADHPYVYNNLDGGTRTEFCAPDQLFSKASTDTLKMMPIGIGHPASRRVTSHNVDSYLKGSTGHTVIREKTADGEFLGITATIFSEQAKQALSRAPGISPGYRVALSPVGGRNDSFEQRDRIYNHVAAGVIPRGGKDVRALFEGLRVDGVEDSDIWVCQFNEDAYRAPIDRDLILPVLQRGDVIDGVVQKTPVDLDVVRFPKQEESIVSSHTIPAGMSLSDKLPVNADECDGDKDCDCKDCKRKKTRAKARGKSGRGFGPDQRYTVTPRGKGMDTTTIELDGISYEGVPILFAQALKPTIERADSADYWQEKASEYEELLDAANNRVDSLSDDLDEANEQLRTQQDRADSLLDLVADDDDEDDESRLDESDVFALAADLAATVDRMREDGLLLQQAGVIKTFNTDFAFIAENLEQLQREMVAAVNPDQGDRVDSYDEGQVAVAYDVAMGAVRQLAQQHQGEDRTDGKYPMLNHGRYSLTTIGKLSKPMEVGPQVLKKMLTRFEGLDDAVFEDATKAAESAFRHPMAMKMM